MIKNRVSREPRKLRESRKPRENTVKKNRLLTEKERQKTSQEINPVNQPKTINTPPVKPIRLDPTRYGDWEKNGRCIDF